MSLCAIVAGLEKQLTNVKEVAKYLKDIYVPLEEGPKPKKLVDHQDVPEGQMKTLLLDTGKLATTTPLVMVKFHEPSCDLQKVA